MIATILLNDFGLEIHQIPEKRHPVEGNMSRTTHKYVPYDTQCVVRDKVDDVINKRYVNLITNLWHNLTTYMTNLENSA